MIDLYIYYQAPDNAAAALADTVRAMQATLASGHGVSPQLKRRPLASDGMLTWMEVYPAVADDFASIVEAAALEAGLERLISGPRHAEVFMDELLCA
jgi:hypothetical protein